MASLITFRRVALLSTFAFALGCDAHLAGPGGGQRGTSGPDGPGMGNDEVPVTKPTTFSANVMRRLNRAEYNNTVRDLLQTQLRPADGFPTDDLGSNFTTVGSALSLSPAYVRAYEEAAHTLIDDLFASDARKSEYVPCDVEAEGDTCANQVLQDFATRAWRRPVTPEEVATLLHPLRVAETVGATATEGLRHAMAAVLISPHFVFKVERADGELDGYEMASRLSYALWGTMPDSELLQAAASGALLTDEGLSLQVDRLLEDERVEALLDNFAGHWLDYYDLGTHEADATLFPEFTPALAESMKQEVNHFILDALRSEAPARGMLTAQHTFVDEALAAHYGITTTRPAGVAEGTPWMVDASAAQRGGLLTLGALLTHTSYTSRTSPVKRGDFVLKHLMCIEIMPPPPDVAAGLPGDDGSANESLRERMERHSQDPECAGCHKVMDPVGFGLHHFDAIGRYQTADEFGAIDATGTMPDGETFDGARELAVILDDMDRFSFCATKHFMTYSIGRILSGRIDEQWAEFIAHEAAAEGGSLRSLIKTVLMSETFRQRSVVVY